MDTQTKRTTTEGGSKQPTPEGQRISLPAVKQEFDRVLSLAKLGEYERQVLVTLVFEGRMEAGELCHKTHVPQAKIYAVIEALGARALLYCEDEAARPKVFIAASPEVIVANLTQTYQEMISASASIEAELTEFYEAALEGVKIDEPSQYVSVQSSRAAIKDELFKAIKDASSVFAVGRDFSWIREIPKAEAHILELGATKGAVRLLAVRRPTKEQQGLAEKLSAAGVEIRVSDRFKSRFLIIDEKRVFLGLRRKNPKVTEPPYVLVRVDSEELVEDYLSNFKEAWTSAKSEGARE